METPTFRKTILQKKCFPSSDVFQMHRYCGILKKCHGSYFFHIYASLVVAVMGSRDQFTLNADPAFARAKLVIFDQVGKKKKLTTNLDRELRPATRNFTRVTACVLYTVE